MHVDGRRLTLTDTCDQLERTLLEGETGVGANHTAEAGHTPLGVVPQFLQIAFVLLQHDVPQPLATAVGHFVAEAGAQADFGERLFDPVERLVHIAQAAVVIEQQCRTAADGVPATGQRTQVDRF